MQPLLLSAVDPAVRMALTQRVVKKYLHGTSVELCIP